MKKILFIAGIVVVAGAIAMLFFFRAGTGPEDHQAGIKGAGGSAAQVSPGKGGMTGAGALSARGGKEKTSRFSAFNAGKPEKSSSSKASKAPDDSAAGTREGISPEGAETRTAAVFPTVTANPEEVVATVNGRPVAIGDVIAPNVLQPGDSLPESAYKKYLDKAIDETLLMQQAQEEGLTDGKEYAEVVADMKKDLDEISSLSEEEKEWRVQRVAKMAAINELFMKEGLVAEKVTPQEVNQYYENNAGNYDWLREREAARGTSPERIERKIKQQIKRDLTAPRKKEIREKQKAYIQSLREDADIKIAQ